MYTYEKFTLRLFPIMLLAVSLVLIFILKEYTFGGITGTFGAVFSISFNGFTIDAPGRKYRQYDRFLWFYMGSWKPLPPPMYVTVVRIKLSSRRDQASPMVGPGDGSSVRTYKLNLVIDDKSRYIPLARGKRMEMLQEGHKLAHYLGIRLLDHTTSEKKWIV